MLKTLRVVGRERADLVDDPAIVRRPRSSRGSPAACARGDVTKTLGLANPLVQQQIDVVEQEPAAIVERDTARGGRPAGEVRRLRQNPRVAQHAASDEHARDPAAQPLDDLLGLDAVAAAEHRNRQSRRRFRATSSQSARPL